VGIKNSLAMSLLVLAVAVAGCGTTTSSSRPASYVPEIAFRSPAVTARKVIPARYRCDLNKIWLPLEWGPLPANTGELVVYVARYGDLKATAKGTSARLLSQALVVGLKPTLHGLRPGKLPHGALVGEYELGSERIPICPAHARAQDFLFRLYALRGRLNIAKGTQGGGLLNKLNSEALAAGTFTAAYGRS
jgi:phosphatidylethanolamine-binding protein (PEBP) family uncharacterized protein